MSIKGAKDLIPGTITKVGFLKLKGVHGGLKDSINGSVYKVPVGAVNRWICGG